MRRMDITARNGLTWTVLDLQPNEYGAYPAAAAPERQVEFYDTRYPITGYGQFVSRYYVQDLLKGHSWPLGIRLDSGSRDWYLDVTTFDTIKTWLAAGSRS